MNLIAPPFQGIKNKWLRENLANFPLIFILALLYVHAFEYAMTGGVFDLKGSIYSFTMVISSSFLAINTLFFVRTRFQRTNPYSFRSFISQLLAMLLGGAAGVILCILLNRLTGFAPSLPGFTLIFTLLNALMPVPVVGIPILLVYFRKGLIESKVKEKEMGIVRIQQLKKKAELQNLQSKINPHFFYNSLNCAASLIKTDAKKADELVMNLSNFFRYSINSGEQFFATVREELAIVGTYISIEQVRYGSWLSMNYEVDVSLLEQMIPRFLLQPLVENALRQQITARQENALLNLRIYSKDQNMYIEIENSVSFSPENLETDYLANIRSRLALLLGESYDLHIKSGKRRVLCIRFYNYSELGKKNGQKENHYE